MGSVFPVVKVIWPELPLEEVPVVKLTLPEIPAAPALGVSSEMAPEEVRAEYPESNEIFPPVDPWGALVLPAMTLTSPPEPWLPVPTSTVM